MKKKNYLAPEIDTLDMELQSFITASGDASKSVGFSSEHIGEGEVGGDNDGGLFGTLE